MDCFFLSDDGVSFSVQKGAQISRSNVRYFKHNDMQDLERVLDDIRVDDLVVSTYLLQCPIRMPLLTIMLCV